MKLDFWCPQCDHHVQVVLHHLSTGGFSAKVEAWCGTAHIRPVRMEQHDPHAPQP